MDGNPLGSSIVVRLEQPLKTPLPMDVTLLGMVMDSRLEQPLKAEDPMDVTLSGIAIDLKHAPPEKRLSLIFLKPFGITRSLIRTSFRYKFFA